MIYNFNLGIGWASSGVEYAQSYRARMLRKLGLEAKFVFMDMFPRENIEHLTNNLGFKDSEVIWLYSYFTDFDIEPVSFTLDDFVKTVDNGEFRIERDGKIGQLVFEGNGNFYRIYYVNETSNLVHRVEYVSEGYLVRKDYFTSARIYSEYYAPKDGQAHMYNRRFFNKDGQIAYEEMNDDENVMYKFKDRLIYSKEDLVGYLVESLKLTKDDLVLIDRSTGIAQSILMNAGDARVGVIIHADHFSEGSTDDVNILWNNYYEYAFSMHKHIDFYVTATEAQRQLLLSQFEKYVGVTPTVYTIPVGALEEIKRGENRRKHSLITASRLAPEKHVDWLVQAAIKAKEEIPDLCLDVYGKGGAEKGLLELIDNANAGGYIALKGHEDLTEKYVEYEAYISASQSEGFGLSLMEAAGSGLPIIGFNERYGNQTFVDDGENGYLIDVNDHMSVSEKVDKLSEAIVKLFKQENIDGFREHSYEKAKNFLEEMVRKKWKDLCMKGGN